MSENLSPNLAPRPAHVPENLVVDFDFNNIPGSDEDVQASYAAVQRKNPDIFWTPRNGGHWVATRADDIVEMQRNTDLFSNRWISLPPSPPDTPRQVPLEIDPPEHAHYRRPLMQALTPSVVGKLEEDVRQVAIDIVERLKPRGECEFIEEFAKVLPIHVFLKLVDLPLEDRDYLLPIAERSVRARDVETRMGAHRDMGAYLMKWVMARREEPGEDLLSQLVNVDISGERISEQEALNYAILVLFGGLDTVAGSIGFIAAFLATHPEHRRRIVENLDDDKFLKAAIEELIRRHGIANTTRVLTKDVTYKGVEFREGDRILPPNLLVGLDDRANANPLVVDFDREKPVHAAFGNGPHACPGATLARREIRVFLKEWLSRIPDFHLKPATKPHFETGQVNGVLRLDLVWP